MKLSEAIRIGAQLRPQTDGRLFHRNDSGQVTSCALGAGFEGAGLLKGDDAVMIPEVDQSLLLSSFDGLEDFATTAWRRRPNYPCPECEDRESTIDDLITHLNDDDGWTREQIADHLESIGY